MSIYKGNMFHNIPFADAYIMKLILHDWNDEECINILAYIYGASFDNGRIFIVEHLIPSSEKTRSQSYFIYT